MPAGLPHDQRAPTTGASAIDAEAHLPLRLATKGSLHGQQRLKGCGGEAAGGQVDPPEVALPVAVTFQPSLTRLSRGGHVRPEADAAFMEPQLGSPLELKGQGLALGRDIPDPQLSALGDPDPQIQTRWLPPGLQPAQHPEPALAVGPQIHHRFPNIQIKHQAALSPARQRVQANLDLLS